MSEFGPESRALPAGRARRAPEPCSLPVRVVVVVSLLLGGSALAAADAAAAKARFASGREMIRDNVGDSYGATKEALLSGIAELREALRLGYSPQTAAYRLIADGYGTLYSRFASPGSAENTTYVRGLREALESVMRLDPSDARARVEYAALVVFRDPAAALVAYDEILARFPSRADVLYLSGELLLRRGRIPEGLDRFERAAEVMNSSDAAQYGPGVVECLEENGREKRAAYWRPILEKRAEAAKGQQ